MRGLKGFCVCLLAGLTWLLAAQLVFARGLDGAMQSVVSVLPEWPPDAKRSEEPEGSGVVVLDGKTILTALHVVDRAVSIRVRTLSGDIFTARIKGRDRATDIAALTIDEKLPVIDLLEQPPGLGERVCAIGNAFGLGLSVTCGVVSGVHRAGLGFNRVEDFVQTDASVNPGSSGGALVTAEGKLVGLLSAIFTKTSDANIGINFAVASNLAMEVGKQLQANGRVKRPISGARLEPVPEKGKTGKLGARVVALRDGLLAAKGGMKIGDIIIEAGGRRIRKPADFVSAMSSLLVADSLEVKVLREGVTQTLSLEK